MRRPPVRFVQPFDVHFRWEDAHVIAYLDGHPEYEAVEAFVAHRAARSPAVRAILTRHDKTQIDHANDATLIAPRREAVLSAVDYRETTIDGLRHVQLGFTSFRGEHIVLALAAVTPTATAFGGLTDPEGHAPDLLPILWRDASAVAAPTTALTIAGVPYTIPPFLEVGVKAFYTEGITVGVVVSGEARHRATDYEIATVHGERVILRRTTGSPQTVEALAWDGALRIRSLRTASASERPGELVLSFAPPLPDLTTPALGGRAARFTIAVDDHRDLVTGRVKSTDTGFVLRPETPVWAPARPIRVAIRHEGESFVVRTTIGPVA